MVSHCAEEFKVEDVEVGRAARYCDLLQEWLAQYAHRYGLDLRKQRQELPRELLSDFHMRVELYQQESK